MIENNDGNEAMTENNDAANEVAYHRLLWIITSRGD